MAGNTIDWLRLHLTPGLGQAGLMRVIRVFGNPEAALMAGPEKWTAAGLRKSVLAGVPGSGDERVERALRSLERSDARILTFRDEEYPCLLKTIHDPPPLLYVRGAVPEGESLAIIGSRHASIQGLRFSEILAAEIAECGITIVSGLARGIDGAAHKGALAVKGATVGVLGCGIDKIYPAENRGIFDQIAERGCLLSEYPPGSEPLAGHFPGRNRIISGLSRGVVVVEAAADSGSLITVDFALDQGRDVFAVPGSVFSKGSEGVNQLLKDGAHVVTCADDILGLLWPEREKAVSGEPEFLESLTGDARSIFQLLGQEPLQIDDLVRKSGLTPQILSDILLNLELTGAVEQLPGKRFVRASPTRCRSISTGDS